MTNLEREFLNIKKFFFPRWDRENLWGVSGSLGIGSEHICPDGHCSFENRTLHILTGEEDHEQMLVHLICHAVTENNHRIHWQERMKKAEIQASQSSMIRLADALNVDLERYKSTQDITAELVEKKSYETALGLPESTPEIWLEVVSSCYEMTGTELIRKFPAAPSRGFRRAEKFLQSRNDRQLSFL
jgi:hypothetical protein